MSLNFMCTKCQKILSSLTVPDNTPTDVLKETRICPYCGGIAKWMKEPKIKITWQCSVCKTRFKTEVADNGILSHNMQCVCIKCGSWAYQQNWRNKLFENRFKYYIILAIIMCLLFLLKYLNMLH
jgi:hypothetical protein